MNQKVYDFVTEISDVCDRHKCWMEPGEDEVGYPVIRIHDEVDDTCITHVITGNYDIRMITEEN